MKELKNYNVEENENTENLQPTFIEEQESTSDNETSIRVSTIVIDIILSIVAVMAILIASNVSVDNIILKITQILNPLSLIYSILKELLITVFLFTGIIFFIKRK